MNDEEIRRLHKIRKTVMEMLRDRGYMVTDAEIEMTRAEFVMKFGENMKRDDLMITKGKSNSSDQICVFFSDEDTVGVKAITPCVTRMREKNVRRAILVVKNDPTTFARTCISEISTLYHLEVFKEAELVVNVTHHVLVPEHRVLSPEGEKSLLEKYSASQLPRIPITDPIARYYGVKVGQVMQIIRLSETAGRYFFYRLVIEDPATAPV